MPAIRNFTEANDLLRSLYEHYKTGVASDFYTLDRMRTLMEHLGNPQEDVRVLHVAGTSGKSSTAYYLAALLQANGARVGLCVSPHIVEVNERVQINLQPLPEVDFCRALGEFWDIITKADLRPSYFETLVAFAYWEFARRKLDYVVMEVGLGGLLDGTNVVSNPSKICVITDIGLDHTRILGDTLEKIATQKAGIVQPHNEVFMYEQGEEVMNIVRTTCQRQQATLHTSTATNELTPLCLPLFQQRNLYLAKETVRFVLARDGRDGRNVLTASEVREAANVLVPGRMEIFQINGKTLIVDGAHNEQKMTALVESIQAKYPGQAIATLISVVQGQDERWQHALDVLIPAVQECIVTSFHQETDDRIKSSVSADAVAAYVKSKYAVTLSVQPDVTKAYQSLLSSEQPILLVTGSLYLLADILRLVSQSTA
jgi:dihydrofolate synthase/folylpolyglutamate synthase